VFLTKPVDRHKFIQKKRKHNSLRGRIRYYWAREREKHFNNRSQTWFILSTAFTDKSIIEVQEYLIDSFAFSLHPVPFSPPSKQLLKMVLLENLAF
jgi:hypothetical protein